MQIKITKKHLLSVWWSSYIGEIFYVEFCIEKNIYEVVGPSRKLKNVLKSTGLYNIYIDKEYFVDLRQKKLERILGKNE